MKAAVPGSVLLGVAGAAIGGAYIFVLCGVRKFFLSFLSGDFLFAQIVTAAKAGADEENSRAPEPSRHGTTAELTQNDQRCNHEKSRDQEPLSVHAEAER